MRRGCRPWRYRAAPGRPRRTAGSSYAHVDRGTAFRVRLRLAQNLVGDGRCVSFTEEDVADQIDDGVALRPPEVAVRRLARRVAQVQEEGRDRVGDDGAYATQH